MAVRTGKLRLELDGEKQFKQAISEINKGSQVLTSEMRKLSEEFKNNEHSTEALSAKSDLLQRQLQQQRDKIQTLRDALQNAAKEYGEADKRTQDWQIKLNDAEAAEARLERQLDETNKELAQQDQGIEADSKSLKSLGDSIDDLASQFGVKLPDGAKKAIEGMEGLNVGTVKAMAGIAAGVAVAVKAVKELYDMAVESAQKVDELESRAMKTGLDAGLLQQLDYAQRFLDFDNIDGSLVKLTQNMGKAREGAAAQAEAFEKLGISVTNADGSLRDSWDVFLETIDALGEIRNETERDVLANDLFGKSYAELKPLIDAGSGALQDYMQKAEALGIVLDEEERAKLAELSDVLEDNKARWDALKDHIALLVAPVFSGIISLINAVITALTAMTEALDSPAMEKMSALKNSEAGGWGLGGGSISAIDEEIEALGRRAEALRVEAELEAAAIAAEAAYAESIEQTKQAAQDAANQMSSDIEALIEAYQQAYDAAKTSLDGQFGLWEQVGEVSKTSISDMMEGLQSQLDYWRDYGANFDDLMSRNIEGIGDFAKHFADGSKESAAALAGLKEASDEEIRGIIETMGETDKARSDMAERFAGLQVDLEGTLGEIKSNYEGTMDALQTATDDVDFTSFDMAVNMTFANLESRAGSAVAYVQQCLAEMQSAMSEIGSAGSYGGGRRASGDYNWRGGLTWVGEAGPELVALPQGSRIWSNQESREMAAGNQSIVINVQGIEQLDEIVRWYDSRRVRGRMA